MDINTWDMKTLVKAAPDEVRRCVLEQQALLKENIVLLMLNQQASVGASI